VLPRLGIAHTPRLWHFSAAEVVSFDASSVQVNERTAYYTFNVPVLFAISAGSTLDISVI